ncbi:MAG TPA: phosphate signaling complex protein PhoU [Acidimicrobiales bacterium]|jgi:phosphate transport system protein|nr:phosphate signaling complex protein PhoU [Acidimicrobiales bacterium]
MVDEARKNFHHKLDELKADIVQLAALVTEGIPRTTQALLDMDLQAAQRVIDNDDVLDTKSIEIEEQCLRLLALQQPMASDLRALMTAVKLNWELERSGDLSVNISKAVRRIYGTPFEPKIRGLLEQMSEQAYTLTKHAVDAYALGDAALAAALDDMDDALDELQAEYIHAIIETHEAGKLKLQAAVQLAMIGRFYERIGDHAVNIGERTRYMVTGWLPEHTGGLRAAARNQPRTGPVGGGPP